MTEGTDTKYMLPDALGSVTAVYDAVIAGLKVGVGRGIIKKRFDTFNLLLTIDYWTEGILNFCCFG